MSNLNINLLEKHLERQVCDYLALDGWICRKCEQNYNERKRKAVGEAGMPDQLCIRYSDPGDPLAVRVYAQVMWIELKRLKGGRISKAQMDWHILERKRGALTIIAGLAFEATIDGFISWYEQSGLKRR